jgi:hypothetical protein
MTTFKELLAQMATDERTDLQDNYSLVIDPRLSPQQVFLLGHAAGVRRGTQYAQQTLGDTKTRMEAERADLGGGRKDVEIPRMADRGGEDQ